MDDDYNVILNNLKFSINKKDIDETLENGDELINFNNNANGAYFDIDYYKNNYLKNKNIDPIKHYLEIGANKGFNPNENFDSKFYLKMNSDVKDKGYNPLVHYIKWGLYEGRLPKLFTLTELLKQNLKKCVKGKNHYLFLINDSSLELLQHFDKNYQRPYSRIKSLKVQQFKKSFLEKKGIPFFSFCIPDKSIICKDFLPFKVEYIHRDIEERNDIIDLKCDELKPIHYSKSDTHTNFKGGKLLSFKILNNIDNSFNLKDFENLIQNSNKHIINQVYDLCYPFNWSYTYAELNIKKVNGTFRGESTIYQPIHLKNLTRAIPKEFQFVHKRKSVWFKNEESYSKLKVLIFHDSTIKYLRDYLSFYFNEMFLYWDHGTFSKELIEWFKPDLVLEIRIERFINGLPTPQWIEDELEEI